MIPINNYIYEKNLPIRYYQKINISYVGYINRNFILNDIDILYIFFK